MNEHYRKPFAVITSAALGVSMLFGTGAGTASAEELLKLTFPDVASTHWAKSHVAKLASVGVIKGYTTGDFRPSNNVTQQEAIVMVIRMIGLEEEALARTADAVTGLGEDQFFSKYVVKAIEEGIINLTEETTAAASGTQPWGQRPATREWLAKLVVRALDESPSSTSAMSFADRTEISADAVGYVNRSQELELVNGIVENGTTYFRPKGAVTRAQIATILSRADKYIPDDPAKYTSGYVASRSGTTLTLQSASGTTTSYTLNTETLVFDEEGAALSLASLTEMTSVRVIHQDGQAYYIEVSSNAAQVETIEGDLVALDTTNMSLVLTLSNGNNVHFSLAPNVAVTNAQGVGSSLTQLTEGSKLRLQRVQGTEVITSLKVLEEAFNDSGTAGVARLIDTTGMKLTFTNDGGNIVTYSVAPNVSLKLKGEPISSLAMLQEGDTFAYEIRDSLVTSIDITIQKYMVEEGEFQGTANSTITILNNGKPEAFLLQKDVSVDIPGMGSASTSDLRTGDLVQLRISGATNQVDKITVTNRNIQVLESVTIGSLGNNFSKNYLLVTDNSGKPYLFTVTDRSRFLLDGTVMHDSLYNLYVKEGRKVNLQVTGDELVRLEVLTKISGTITDIDTSLRTITVRRADNSTITMPYLYGAFLVIPRQSSTSFSELTVGSKVELALDQDLTTVTSIRVEKSFVVTLTGVTPNSRTITILDANGVSSSISVDSSASVKNRGGQTVAVSALTPGTPIILNYVGANIVSVQEASVTHGKVTTLDVTGGRLGITDTNNNVRSFDLNGGITIQNGTNVSTNASSLKLNDRVQLIMDAQGKPYLRVAQMEIRRFSSYNASTNEMTLKIVRVGEQSKFPVDPNVIVRTKSGETMTLSRLKDNDQLTVYLIGGKIVEIEL